MQKGRVFSLAIVSLAIMEANAQGRPAIAAAARTLEQSTTEFACAQPLDLHVERKRHVRAERWLQVRRMGFVASVQHVLLWQGGRPHPDQPINVTPMGIPDIIDIFALAPWQLLRTALRQWSVAGDSSLG